MGSSYAWKLDADIHCGEQFIIDTANAHPEFKDDKNFKDFMWRHFSPETKWWALQFVADISKNINAIFRLDATGDAHFTCFIYKGEILNEEDIWDRPKFPSRPLFKKKLSETKTKIAIAEQQRKAAAEKAAKERIEKELEALKMKQQELEKRLAG